MIQSRRYSHDSKVLNNFVERELGQKKIASTTNHPASRLSADNSVNKSNHPASKFLTASISAYQARVARREGIFVKVAGRNDLYQEATTSDFWKISEDGQKVNRVVNEKNGVIVE